jgi:G3E family GTPase
MLKWKIPVVVVTGYLGSGKTTLLKNILKGTKKKVAVLMNEFGEIGIDTKIIKGKNVDIKEMLGGCVCCSLTGELEAAIGEVLEKTKPDMIVTETTGVAEPDAIVTNIRNMRGVKLDSVVTVVDADAFVKFPSLGHTGRLQIEGADVILLNKMDLVKAGDIDGIVRALQQINPQARIIKTTYSNVDTDSILGVTVEKPAREHEPHDASEFESFTYTSRRVHGQPSFVKFVQKIPREIYRAKGYVMFPEGSHIFSFVNGRHEISKSDSGTETEIVFIGRKIKKFEKKVLEGLRSCQI